MVLLVAAISVRKINIEINLESRKVELYICIMKSIKIPEAVHTEIKIFLAKNTGETITEFVGYAALAELKNRGHKFSNKQSKKINGKA